VHRLDGALLEEAVETRDGLPLRQSTDVDASDSRARGELAAWAREGEPDQDGEQRGDASDDRGEDRSRHGAPPATAARRGER